MFEAFMVIFVLVLVFLLFPVVKAILDILLDWQKMNILAEFEKRYNGDPTETEKICREIAIENDLNIEETTDFVYIYIIYYILLQFYS